jgi:hypothetical protein
MTLGQWKQMWLKKMPHADQGMFRYPPAMNGSFIAYFDGWENTPGARWDPQQSVSEEQLDELKCWPGHHRVAGTKAGAPGSCEKNKTNEEGVEEESSENKYSNLSNRGVNRGIKRAGDDFNRILDLDQVESPHYKTQHQQDTKQRLKTKPMAGPKGVLPEQGMAEAQHSESCPHCGGEMVSEELMNEKKDACYYKVKSRYKVWPSAYASGALVKCRNKGASNWGNGGKKNESSILEGINRADESLHDWFNKEKWVRMDTKGNIKGPCAKEPGEGKPKCLSKGKAAALRAKGGKKAIAAAVRRKRSKDTNPERKGSAINVSNKI